MRVCICNNVHFETILLLLLGLFTAKISCISYYKGDPGNLGDAVSDLTEYAVKSRSKRNILAIPSASKLTFVNKLSIPAFSKHGGNITGTFATRIYIRYTFPDNIGIGRSNPMIDRERSISYSSVSSMFDSFGLNGTECLLKSICESADDPVKGYGILDELILMFLSPSHNIESERTSLRKYIKAEVHGRTYGSCEEKYPECTLPFADLVHAGITSMMDTAAKSGTRYKQKNEL